MIMSWPFCDSQLTKGSKHVEQLGELCSILSLTSSRNLGCFSYTTGMKSVQSWPSPLWVHFNSDVGDWWRKCTPAWSTTAAQLLMTRADSSYFTAWTKCSAKLEVELRVHVRGFQVNQYYGFILISEKIRHPGNPRNWNGKEKASSAEAEVTEMPGQGTRAGVWHSVLWCLEERDQLYHGRFPKICWKYQNYTMQVYHLPIELTCSSADLALGARFEGEDMGAGETL